MNKQYGDTWHEDTCHVGPNKWTLGTWKAKCHILIMHELSGGGGGGGGGGGVGREWHEKHMAW